MNIESKLLELLQENSYQTYKPKQLAKMLQISTQNYPTFRKKLKELVAEGKIFKYKRGRLGAGRKVTEVVGRLHVKTQGYGFLITEDDDTDIFISHSNMATALHGDTVKVLLFARPSEGKSHEGEVVEVIKRARKNIVGTFQQGKYWSIVVADDLKIQRDFYIAPENTMNAQNGQKVVINLVEWEDEHTNPVARVVEILGDPKKAGVDIVSVARSFDLPARFSRNALAEAENTPIEIPAAEIEKRLDWRNELTFTIDPIDAKDFDDAVSLKVLENKNYLLGVHIADVSHYVKPGSQLDKESQDRATSVYLVDRVVPMLPEWISNEVCCLKPNADKLAFSVLIELNPSADMVNYEIKKSIIHSDRRFIYEEVQEIIDGKKDKRFADPIMRMFDLSKKLIEKREQRGSLDFASQEVRFKLNDEGKPVSIEKLVQLDSHRLIEEFMVLANSIVARHIAWHLKEKTGGSLPFPYRIHERPSAEKLKDFTRFTRALGIDFAPKKRVTPKLFQNLQHAIKGKEIQLLVEEVMIRTMMKARYSTRNDGHFGLALKNYCHFTSPIRRYPDLMAHRLLKHYLSDPKRQPMKKRELEKICEHATEQEIKAMEAERASVKVKQLEFMQDKIGETFHGIISGVTSFGIFVEITDYLIEGMVHITELRNDYYIYEETKYRLVGQYHGQVYQLGDPVVVMVVLVNPEERIIDFELIESLRERA
jgi:ribonuclease R